MTLINLTAILSILIIKGKVVILFFMANRKLPVPSSGVERSFLKEKQ
ncbi:hypothetical protein SAMN04487764_1739 [Gillisia sp. Hel1_33_143]|nr:hypothetical protein SAMN04487764_1739 [Gillisia sp. Hel1_33_143]